jgi:ABC-type glycerol-3-phosphate transport system substrate-binding protein
MVDGRLGVRLGRRLAQLGLLLSLAWAAGGCGAWPLRTPSTATLPATATRAAATPSRAAAAPSATAPAIEKLRLWLPPQLDPDGESAAGQALAARLADFAAARPTVQIEVRIKGEDGPGGLLDSLAAAGAAAPRSLPDLVALPHPIFEVAAVRGLLHPFQGLTLALDQPDWFPAARNLGQLQASSYGLPFALDALVLIYDPAQVTPPPASWEDLLAAGTSWAFLPNDPNAAFLLSQYRALDGKVLDPQGRPMLQVEPLTEVLGLVAQAQTAQTLPAGLTGIANEDALWALLQAGRVGMIVDWYSHYQAQAALSPTADWQVAPLPSASGEDSTLASGWVWALASGRPQNHAASVALAEFLTAPEFLAVYTPALGLLPARPSAVSGWPAASERAIIERIATSARLLPAFDVLNGVGPVLGAAGLSVLSGETSAAQAAQTASAKLTK